MARPLSMFYVEQEARRAAKKGWSKRLLACRSCKAEEMRRVAARKRKFLDQYKTQAGCVDCGLHNDAHPEVFDFDHRPGTDKKFNLAQSLTKSMAAILTEIAKCDVVCANCHRIRTVTRMRS